MVKKLVRSLLIGFLVFLTGILIFYAAFRITYKKSVKAASEALSIQQTTSAAVPNGNALKESEIIDPDYFIARYDGKSLAVYCVSDGKEEFLYTLNARIEDISESELNELKKGIRLDDKKALASFEEDFTS